MPAPLITKEQLEKQAKPRDKDRRRSTLEESDLQSKVLNKSSTDEGDRHSVKKEKDKKK